MPTKSLVHGSIPFETEGRLLQELGLRLVASPEVALVELIKNAYDADSPSCSVSLDDGGRTLIVADEGHGMTLDDFRTKWMRVATSSKIAQEFSPMYRRRLTGAKGIGRFAVRYLGDNLTLTSVAVDSVRGCRTRLSAVFDWPKLESVKNISEAKVDFRLHRVPDSEPAGTVLRICQLRSTTDFTLSTVLRDQVLRIVSPIQGLNHGKFAGSAVGGHQDPGFHVVLPGEGKTDDLDLAKLVLDNAWARLTVQLDGRSLEFQVWLPGATKPKPFGMKANSTISKGFYADVRFFPKRKGVFQGKGIDGRKAWRWVRDNCGVAVVDHGFRIKPYGFGDDDWLQLDVDKAHSRRDWRSRIAKEHFPVPPEIRGNPADNPVLYLPYNFQLVGAVFIQSKRTSASEEERDLVPSMDREGLLRNEGFEQLFEFVRAGIEFLAKEDKAEIDRRAALEAKEAADTARGEIRAAIEFIKRSPTLTPGDKSRIVKEYKALADRLDEQEQYAARARRSLITMGLLGVVAGFMTHESKAIVHELEQGVKQLRLLSKKHPDLGETAEELSQSVDRFQGYLDYARLFIQNVQPKREEPLRAAGQVRHVLKRFEAFANEHGVRVTNEVPAGVMTPALPVTVYSGVLLNLYTNALKAVISASSSIAEPRITFRAWNERGKHVVEVADNGVGVPPELQRRIWEPLYTTTSDVGNPLGSGMGLGLTLVKQVVAEFHGSVSLVPDPPPGFTTCFRVVFPNP